MSNAALIVCRVIHASIGHDVRIVVATVDAGGNGPPTVKLLQVLAARGHETHVLGDRGQQHSFERAGLSFVSWTTAREWNPRPTNPNSRTMLAWLTLASDRRRGRELADAANAGHADLIVVDCMLPAVLEEARRVGVPVAILVHAFSGYWRRQWSLRTPMGIWLRATRVHPARLKSVPDLVVLTTSRDLDPVTERPPLLPTSIVQTGPLLPTLPVGLTEPTRDAPFLVSFSTIAYPRQLQCLQRVLDALGELPVRAVATVGSSLDATVLRVPGNVELRGYMPHENVFPHVRGLIGHGGHGTTMLALAYGLPVLVVPMSRHSDQPLVGAAVTAAGAGLTVPREASVAELRTAIEAMLGDTRLRLAAVELSKQLRAVDGAASAARAIEDLGPAGPT